MMEDVPTMAIELVNFITNTSVIHDEHLAGRFGLVPIKANPLLFEFPEKDGWQNDIGRCIKFSLFVTGERQNQPVYSGQLQWVPLNNAQKAKLANDPPKPVHDDIMLAKLKPGQTISVELFACKGTGAVHAKFSPVSPVAYRMFPKVELCNPDGKPTIIDGDEAVAIKKCCSRSVFAIEDSHLVVSDTRSCTMCRECVREGNRGASIRLSRLKDFFIFTVESTGVYSAKDIVRQALEIFEYRCRDLVHVVENARVGTGPMEVDA
jgi:DNA-directed RNA polymerase I and III subunit RPAC1